MGLVIDPDDDSGNWMDGCIVLIALLLFLTIFVVVIANCVLALA